MVPEHVWSLFERMQAEIAREIRVLLGEEKYDERIFTTEERIRRIEAMKKSAASVSGEAERHVEWMQMHFDQGWTYGAEFIPSEKKHPNLKPWDELPASVRSKARIFDIVATYADTVATILEKEKADGAAEEVSQEAR